MRLFDYKCEECGYIIKDVEVKDGQNFPKRKNCPKCGAVKSCYKLFTSSIKIPVHMKAIKNSGSAWAREYMKKAKKPSGRGKRFF